ncbi:MAG: glycosyltransferase family 8 protein [Fibrobacter sp.]|nr:glycosyltransferase family 8 protein [Fibrobacter sp.]
METVHIPVILSSDNNQVFAMAVVMTSAVQTASENTFYDFYCFLSNDVTAENRERLKRCADSKNCSVTLMDMSEYFKNGIQYNGAVGMVHSVTTPALYRLKAPSVLPQYSKVLYLDTDTLVRADLRELFETPMEDVYMAGVPVVWAQIKKSDRNRWLRQSGIPGMDYYVNSGVLLMNLDAMRKDGVEEKCLSLVGKKEFAPLDPADQLILNYACYGKIGFVPCRYNVTMSNMKHAKRMTALYSLKEVRDAFEDPYVIHWTGAGKPWKYYDVLLAHEWWRRYVQSPFGDIPLNRSAKPGMFGNWWRLFKKAVLK